MRDQYVTLYHQVAAPLYECIVDVWNGVVGYVDDEEDVVLPQLAAGHYNVSCKKLIAKAKSKPLLVVGFSSPKCDRCVEYESQYMKATQSLTELQVTISLSCLRCFGLVHFSCSCSFVGLLAWMFACAPLTCLTSR